MSSDKAPKDPQWTIDPKIKVNCRDCGADCCKHIAIPIDAPKTIDDFERIKWYIAHDGICVYRDNEGDWLVEFLTRCGQLNGNLCMAWGTDRYPRICKEYSMVNCVMNEEGEYWEVIFRTPQDVDAYVREQGITGTPVQPIPYPVCVCVPIDDPEDWEGYDDLRWYIAHHDVSVLHKDGQWYVHLNTQCRAITSGHTCALRNAHRPHDGELFETWEQLEEHCRRLGVLPAREPTTLTLSPR